MIRRRMILDKYGQFIHTYTEEEAALFKDGQNKRKMEFNV